MRQINITQCLDSRIEPYIRIDGLSATICLYKGDVLTLNVKEGVSVEEQVGELRKTAHLRIGAVDYMNRTITLYPEIEHG